MFHYHCSYHCVQLNDSTSHISNIMCNDKLYITVDYYELVFFVCSTMSAVGSIYYFSNTDIVCLLIGYPIS